MVTASETPPVGWSGGEFVSSRKQPQWFSHCRKSLRMKASGRGFTSSCVYHSGTGPRLEGSIFRDTFYGLCSWSEALKTWFPAALPCWLLHLRTHAHGFSPQNGCNTSHPAVSFLQGPFTPLGPSLQPSWACWHPVTPFHTCPKVSVEESPSWDSQDIQAGEGLSSLCPGPALRTDPALGHEPAGKGTTLGVLNAASMAGAGCQARIAEQHQQVCREGTGQPNSPTPQLQAGGGLCKASPKELPLGSKWRRPRCLQPALSLAFTPLSSAT